MTYSTKKLRSFVSSSLLALIALIYLIVVQREIFTPSIAQYLAFPLAMAVMYWHNSFLPRRLLVSALIAFLFISPVAFSLRLPSDARVIVSVLPEDDYEVHSTRFRELISKDLRALQTGNAARFRSPISSLQEAQEVLAENPSASLTVFSDRRWTNIALGSLNNATIPIVIPSPVASHPDPMRVRAITTVPVIGLSTSPEAATASFIASLSALLSQESPSVQSDPETFARGIADTRSQWTSFAHLSYPLLLVANSYLLRATHDLALGNIIPRAELGCARDAYSEAAALLQPYDNPPLRAALFNNKGITLFLMGVIRDDRPLLRVGRKHFQFAGRILERPNRWGADTALFRRVTRHNLQVAKEWIKSTRRTTSKKRKHKKRLANLHQGVKKGGGRNAQ